MLKVNIYHRYMDGICVFSVIVEKPPFGGFHLLLISVRLMI